MKFSLLFSYLTAAALAHAGGGNFLSPPGSGASPWNGARPDGHAPIGVMGDHTHDAGEFMVSYRYMFMAMQRNFSGDNEVSDPAVLADPRFAIVPTDMDMEMYMFGLMYAPTSRLTLTAMVNLVELSMNHRTAMGGTFRTDASGLGDSSLTALYRFWDGDGQRAHAGLGILLPTAETDESDFLPPAGGVRRLPYPMQLGAGSWGLAPSLTYLGQGGPWSWGGQLGGKFYLDDNDEGYRLGNRGEASVWGARQIHEMVSASLRVTASTWGNIDGRDPRIAGMVPTADPALRGGSRLDLSAGFNLYESGNGVRLAAEAGLPLWQHLDGPQLGVDWWSMLGFQWAW
ncbi:MAG: transporter [Akkermansiaceae bacterium]|nr:transporter [Akkermansiaceae bacterium]